MRSSPAEPRSCKVTFTSRPCYSSGIHLFCAINMNLRRNIWKPLENVITITSNSISGLLTTIVFYRSLVSRFVYYSNLLYKLNYKLELEVKTTSVHSYNTRAFSHGKFHIKYSHLNQQCNSFTRLAAEVWNKILSSI